MITELKIQLLDCTSIKDNDSEMTSFCGSIDLCCQSYVSDVVEER